MGLASMDEVALCLRFMDLLRQDLPAVGEGMAEASCCPLRLLGTVPLTPLPFIPPGVGIPLTDSKSRRRQKRVDQCNFDKDLFIVYPFINHESPNCTE